MGPDHYNRHRDMAISQIWHVTWRLSDRIGGLEIIVTCNMTIS